MGGGDTPRVLRPTGLGHLVLEWTVAVQPWAPALVQPRAPALVQPWAPALVVEGYCLGTRGMGWLRYGRALLLHQHYISIHCN